MGRAKLSYADVLRLFADRGIVRKETDDGSVYLDRGDREMPIPLDAPFEAWVALAVELFELDDAYDLLRDPKTED